MICPKCGKDTCVLVTTEAKTARRERSFFKTLIWIITFPVWGLWVVLFGKKQTYYKTQHWHCNYCNADIPQTPAQ